MPTVEYPDVVQWLTRVRVFHMMLLVFFQSNLAWKAEDHDQNFN